MDSHSQDQNTENTDNHQPNLIDIITANTQVNVVLSILEQIDFTLIQKMIEATPTELKDNENYRILVAAAVFESDIRDIYSNVQNKSEESKIIV